MQCLRTGALKPNLGIEIYKCCDLDKSLNLSGLSFLICVIEFIMLTN